eukprot:5924297-Amphidinium_carterae.1
MQSLNGQSGNYNPSQLVATGRVLTTCSAWRLDSIATWNAKALCHHHGLSRVRKLRVVRELSVH